MPLFKVTATVATTYEALVWAPNVGAVDEWIALNDAEEIAIRGSETDTADAEWGTVTRESGTKEDAEFVLDRNGEES